MSAAFVNSTCRVGQAEPCGQNTTHLIAVVTVTNTGWATGGRTGGVVGLCDFHANTPPADWDNVEGEQ